MKESHLRQLLKEQTDIFINNIAVELEEPHDRWFDNFGFPILGQISKEYHEQVYFQSYLESYTRKMINSILREICYEDAFDHIAWPELDYPGIYNGYTNAECEGKFGFEFINCDQKIGYRYTFIKPDEIDHLLNSGNVETAVLVIWQDEDNPAGFHYKDARIRVVLLWDLFQELFCELDEDEVRMMYDLFADYVSKAVAQANSMISLVTLPGFTPSYLYKTREKVIDELINEINSLSAFFVNNQNYKYVEQNSKQLITNYKLPVYFLGMQMEHAFVGFSDFAKSYLTSEYLFHYFKDNSLFDYTPIVSGYIKSIEQLLHIICVRYRNSQHVYINMGSYTLGQYIDYLRKNAGIFRNTILPAKDIIINCLDSYRAESRNHLFHKDYLNSWGRVEQIRTNTIFLYMALMGAVNDTLIIENDTLLGSLNVEYDRLFQILDAQAEQNYTFILNGTEYLEMAKQPRYKGLIFDRNGLITNSIHFKKFNYDHYEEVEISRKNMPSEIWIAGPFRKKGEKIWPIT